MASSPTSRVNPSSGSMAATTRCPNVIGCADHRDAPYAGHIEQHSLDLGRIDIGSSSEDQGIPAVPNEEATLLIEIPDVPRIEDTASNRSGGCLWMSQVAQHGSIGRRHRVPSLGLGR